MIPAGRRPRSLIVTGDDFGSSHEVNAAIIEAHAHGVLTSASLMVCGGAFEEAVALAKQNLRLAVGLHLTISCEKAVSSPGTIPQVVCKDGRFPGNLWQAGCRYSLKSAVRRQIALEIRAQLERFRATGLRLSHVDGHQHMHLVPAILDALVSLAPEFGIRSIRLPREEFGLAVRLDPSGFSTKALHQFYVRMLRPVNERQLRAAGIFYADRVYGFLQTGKVTERYLLDLIPRIRHRAVEIYAHPTLSPISERLGASRSQLDALLSPRVREALEAAGFCLSTYDEMSQCTDS